MNYIRHLSAFFEKIASDHRLNASHVSLYMALFQFWNLNRFENPVLICRTEVLELCKIGSLNTYHKCLHDLHTYGYIEYVPSHNPMKGSLVNLYNFDTTKVQVTYNPRRKIDTTSVQVMRRSINILNNINNKTLFVENSHTQNSKKENLKRKKKSRASLPGAKPLIGIQKEKLGGGRCKKVEVENRNPDSIGKKIPPFLDQVTSFFKSENFPELEAQKFFNHFQSNGWKVGGKAPMKDWQAAARNWMLNSNLFTPPVSKPQRKLDPNNKNYSEPL